MIDPAKLRERFNIRFENETLSSQHKHAKNVTSFIFVPAGLHQWEEGWETGGEARYILMSTTFRQRYDAF